jgi:hypothetical protein
MSYAVIQRESRELCRCCLVATAAAMLAYRRSLLVRYVQSVLDVAAVRIGNISWFSAHFVMQTYQCPACIDQR